MIVIDKLEKFRLSFLGYINLDVTPLRIIETLFSFQQPFHTLYACFVNHSHYTRLFFFVSLLSKSDFLLISCSKRC